MHQRMSTDAALSSRYARAYLVAFVGGVASSLILFFCMLGLLGAIDRLPPPPVSGTWCIDSRFAWLRREEQWKRVGLAAVGSSTTLRNIDLSVAGLDVVNVAPCFLTINQTRYLTEFLLQYATQVKVVMTVLTIRDLDGCARNQTAFFDTELADKYITGRIEGWWLYFRNFRLRDIFLHALYASERLPLMQYDQYGSSPLQTDASDPGRAWTADATCFAELRSFAAMLESRNIQLVAVTFPVMPEWASLHDDSGKSRADFKDGVKSALRTTNAILVDGMDGWPLASTAFADPVHLHWSSAAGFTRFIWASAQGKGAALPNLRAR